MKQQIENIIKKNFPEEKLFKEEFKCGGCNTCEACLIQNDDETRGFNQALSQINTTLIADEVLKVVVEKIKKIDEEERHMENGDYQSYVLGGQHTINKILQELSNLSPNKENKK